MMRTTGHPVTRRLGLAVAVVALTGLLAGPAAAQDEGMNTGAVSLSAGIDFTSAYFFRGIIQQTEGGIVQPYLDASLTVHEADEGLQSVSLFAGTWNSLHTEDVGFGRAMGDPQLWYESDFFAGLNFGFADAWSADLTYTVYTSPNQRFTPVSEVSLGVSYDDGVVGPYVLAATELSGQADGGMSRGSYLEVGIGPGVGIPDSDVTLSFPFAVGMSLSDYFEGADGDGRLGFASLGIMFSVPIAVPSQYGSWEFGGGVNMLFFGDALVSINGSPGDGWGEGREAIGVLSLSMSY